MQIVWGTRWTFQNMLHHFDLFLTVSNDCYVWKLSVNVLQILRIRAFHPLWLRPGPWKCYLNKAFFGFDKNLSLFVPIRRKKRGTLISFNSENLTFRFGHMVFSDHFPKFQAKGNFRNIDKVFLSLTKVTESSIHKNVPHLITPESVGYFPQNGRIFGAK